MKIRIFFLLLALFGIANAQSPAFCWGEGSVGTGHDEGHDVATDQLGNVYITGSFNSGTIGFGPYTLSSPGGDQVYLVKYDPTGAILWARSSGDNGGRGYRLAIDPTGNVYVAGTFNSTISFGTNTLSNGGAFLVKYDANGNALWARSAGATNDAAKDVATDASGNVYITGSFYSTSISFGTFTFPNSGGTSHFDLFLAKYDPSGNVLWAKSAGGMELDEAKSVAVDNAGNVFITGYSNATTAITFGTYSFTGAGYFLVKYDGGGNVVWAQYNANNDEGQDLGTDGFGNIYMRTDNTVVKFLAGGSVAWTRNMPGIGRSLATDQNGGIYVTGSAGADAMPFNVGTFTFVFNPAVDPCYIAKLDTLGTVICADALASGGDDDLGVATDLFGNAFLSADYKVIPFIVGPDTLPTAGDESIFVAKFNCLHCGEHSAVDPAMGHRAISLYPNPISSHATLEMDISLEEGTLVIYNAAGQRVRQVNNLSGQKHVLQRGDLPCGIYFLQVTQRGEILASDKFLVSDN